MRKLRLREVTQSHRSQEAWLQEEERISKAASLAFHRAHQRLWGNPWDPVASIWTLEEEPALQRAPWGPEAVSCLKALSKIPVQAPELPGFLFNQGSQTWRREDRGVTGAGGPTGLVLWLVRQVRLVLHPGGKAALPSETSSLSRRLEGYGGRGGGSGCGGSRGDGHGQHVRAPGLYPLPRLFSDRHLEEIPTQQHWWFTCFLFSRRREVSTLQGRRGRAEGHLPGAVAVSGSQQRGLLLEQRFTVHSGG